MKFFIVFKLLIIIILISCEGQTSKSITINKAISFKDQIGRTINLEKAAIRIVAIPKSANSMIIALDNGIRRLQGIHPLVKRIFMKGPLSNLFPEIKKIRSNLITNRTLPNIEELLKVRADLIFQWGSKLFQPQFKSIEMMEKVGLKVAAFQWDGDNDFTEGQIKMIGKAINKTRNANYLIKRRQKIFQKIKNIVEKIEDKDRLKTFYVYQQKQTYLMMESAAMKLLKVNNPAQNKKIMRPSMWNINREEILELDPEIIFLNALQKGGYPKDFYEDELLKNLNASKNKRVYKMPFIGHGGSAGGSGSHEDPLTWMWMAMILYPDYFNFDLRANILSWYKIMYKKKIITEDQIDAILRFDINKESKGYLRFTK